MPDHHSAPYSLTEDFVTVYRLHPLLPDDYCFYHHQTGEKIAEKGFMDIQGGDADDAMRLFGIQHVTVQLERREMYEREDHLHA